LPHDAKQPRCEDRGRYQSRRPARPARLGAR
jgi:hypothetical protein